MSTIIWRNIRDYTHFLNCKNGQIVSVKADDIKAKRIANKPDDYLNYGLGSTESSLIIIAEEFAKLGHRVSVFNYTYKEGVYRGVRWYNIYKFKSKNNYDVLISIRSKDIFKDELNIPVKCLWLVDSDTLYIEEFLDDKKIDLVITVSAFQEKKLLKNHPQLRSILFRGDLPYDDELYKKYSNILKIKGKCIFCSVPHRGLQYLVDMWPLIIKKAPGARLYITSSLELWGLTRDESEIMFGWLYSKIRKMKNVVFLGKIPKEELAKHQAESQLMLYPNSVDELSCISLLECLSTGTVPISTKKGALGEKIINNKNGYVISGNPDSLCYQKKFIEKTLFLLRNDVVREEMSIKCRDNINVYSRINIANKWMSKFYEILKNK